MDNAYKRENSCRNDVEYICELEHLILPEENKVPTLYAPLTYKNNELTLLDFSKPL